MRCRHRPARPGPCPSDHDAGHLQPSVAQRRGPNTRCRGQSHVGIGGPIPGHIGHRKPL